MKPPNPLPFDPRPHKAHPKERATRKQMEKENPGFNWMPIGVLALLGITLAMNVEKDVKKCEERKEKDPNYDSDDGDDDRRGGKGEDRSRRHHPQQRERRDKNRDHPRRGRSVDGGRDRYRDRDRGYGRDASWCRDCESDRRSYDGRRAYGYDGDYEYRRPRRWSGERYR